jgi:hypothetical protein
MTTNDDFLLFGPADGSSDAPSAEEVLISAYLAHELSPVQMAAVEERLSNDRPFRETVQPILDLWAVDRVPRVGAPVFTTANVEAGWIRFLDESKTTPTSAPDRGAQRGVRIAAGVVLAIVAVAGAAHAARWWSREHSPAGRAPNSDAGTPAPGALPGGSLESNQSRGVSLEALSPAASVAAANGGATSAQFPPDRDLGPVIAQSAVRFQGILQVRELGNGVVVVNDSTARSITLLDARLAGAITTLDLSKDVVGKPDGRAGIPATIDRYRGDSILLYSPITSTFRLLDPNGREVRSLETTAGWLVPPTKWSGVYGLVRRNMSVTRVDRPLIRTSPSVQHAEASYYLRGFDFNVNPHLTLMTRQDTLTTIAERSFLRYTAPSVAMRTIDDPFFTADAWTVGADGSVIVLRGRDYRLEFFTVDRRHLFGPEIPHEWSLIGADRRQSVADSVNASRRETFNRELPLWVRDSAALAAGKPPLRSVPGRGSWLSVTDLADGTIEVTLWEPGPGGSRIGRPRPSLNLVKPDELPNRLPAVDIAPGPPTTTAAFARPDALLADADHRVWIRPQRWMSATRATPAPAYDIVDREGRLIDRVRIPADRKIVGFGPGVVYLTTLDGTRLERARFR